jgi:hypothetical protein
LLFNEWYAHLRGEDEYFATLRKHLIEVNALRTQRRKAIVIGGPLAESEPTAIHGLITTLVADYFQPRKSLWDATPWTVIFDGRASALSLLKGVLSSSGLAYNDGHEDHLFSPVLFGQPPIVSRHTTPGGKPTEYIGRASFSVHLVSSKSFTDYRQQIEPPEIAFVAAPHSPATWFSAEHTKVYHLGALTNLDRLASLLRKP